MVPGIFYVHHSVGVVRIDRVDNRAYAQYSHISSCECVRLNVPKIVLRTNPWTERQNMACAYILILAVSHLAISLTLDVSS